MDNNEWPELDYADGYPVDEGFHAYRNLPLNFNHAARFLVRELPWCAEHCCASCDVDETVEAVHIGFSTGGWSGAESLLSFIESRYDTSHFMESWRKGGHYEFSIPKRYL